MTELNALAGALEKQNDQLEQLIDLLENELHLISTREAEPLISLVKKKETLLDSIHNQDAQVEHLYHQLSSELQESAEVQAYLHKPKQLLEQCKYRTEINQKAVEQGQLRLDHLRSLLLESRAKENMTYDKSGKAQAKSSGKDYTA